METKRCVQCRKLSRADALTCSRCGYTFVEKKRQLATRDLSRQSRPSLPAASPHRAGHYSGLHPEDQPYQSRMIAVHHALNAPMPESEDVLELAPEPLQELPMQELAIQELSPRGDDAVTQMSTRIQQPQHGTDVSRATAPAYNDDAPPQLDTDAALPAFYTPHAPDIQYTPPVPEIPYAPYMQFAPNTPLPIERPRRAKGAISVLLTLSCIFFLLASGILVYALMSSKPVVQPKLELAANPSLVRAGDTFMLSGSGFTPTTQVEFTNANEQPLQDSTGHPLGAIADKHGAFSIDIVTPEIWGSGAHTIIATDQEQSASTSTSVMVEAPSIAPPQLQLSTPYINFGTSAAGTTSHQQIILKNVGGSTLSWKQASDASWLTATPTGSTGYTFSGSETVAITANRSNLLPNTSHIGHIVFAQKDGTNTHTLTVAMNVDAAPAVLNVSPLSLSFASTSTQSVPTQSITLQNSGGKPLNWQATASTNDGANWLFMSGATSGSITPSQGLSLTIGVQGQSLSAGLYQGAITLTGGASATISISLNVLAPGNILVTPTALNFTGFTQQSVAGKPLTLQNTGGQAQAWSTSIAVDQGNWLSISSRSGSVNAGQQVQTTVNIDTSALKANSYQGSITFTLGGLTTTIPVTLTLTTSPVAVILIQNTSLTFQTPYHTNPSGQQFAITNGGNAVLNWMATASGNGASFALLSSNSGSLQPQNSVIVEVDPNVATLPAGTLSTTITISDSDAGTMVTKQGVAVSITIQPGSAAISLSVQTLPINAVSGTNPTTQSVTLTNTGTTTLNWNSVLHMATPTNGTWLSIDTTNGSLTPGTQITLIVSCDATGLTKGTTYNGTLQISDSDIGTTVTPQTLSIAFTP